MNDRQVAALVEDGKLQDLFLQRICLHLVRFIVPSRIALLRGKGHVFETPDGPRFASGQRLAPGQTFWCRSAVLQKRQRPFQLHQSCCSKADMSSSHQMHLG